MRPPKPKKKKGKHKERVALPASHNQRDRQSRALVHCSVCFHSVCFKSERVSDKPVNDSLSGGKVEDEHLKLKKKQFPGLAISDNPERAKSLLEPTEDEKVTWEAMNQVRSILPPC